MPYIRPAHMFTFVKQNRLSTPMKKLPYVAQRNEIKVIKTQQQQQQQQEKDTFSPSVSHPASPVKAFHLIHSSQPHKDEKVFSSVVSSSPSLTSSSPLAQQNFVAFSSPPPPPTTTNIPTLSNETKIETPKQSPVEFSSPATLPTLSSETKIETPKQSIPFSSPLNETEQKKKDELLPFSLPSPLQSSKPTIRPVTPKTLSKQPLSSVEKLTLQLELNQVALTNKYRTQELELKLYMFMGISFCLFFLLCVMVILSCRQPLQYQSQPNLYI